VVANSKKTDLSKQGLNSVVNPTVKLNLMGKSKSMEAKDWVDPQGRKGKASRERGSAPVGAPAGRMAPREVPARPRGAMWPRELATSPCGREAPPAAGPAWQLAVCPLPRCTHG
jgi:hypothetical protein